MERDRIYVAAVQRENGVYPCVVSSKNKDAAIRNALAWMSRTPEYGSRVLVGELTEVVDFSPPYVLRPLV